MAPEASGWLRIELTVVVRSRAQLAALAADEVIPTDLLWTRTDLGESGFASLFLSTGQHFRVRLARAASGYVATIVEERPPAPLPPAGSVFLSVDLLRSVFDAPPELGVGDELTLHHPPSPDVLLSVDGATVARGRIVEAEGTLGVQIVPIH